MTIWKRSIKDPLLMLVAFSSALAVALPHTYYTFAFASTIFVTRRIVLTLLFYAAAVV